MKTAKGYFTCKTFEETVSGYIDNELTDVTKKAFLAHAQVCPQCNELLRGAQSLKKCLECMAPTNVSPDFDQRMSILLRNENVRMRDPKYRFKLFVLDNWKVFTTIPAAAVLVFGIVFLGPNVHFINDLRMDTVMTEQAGNPLSDDVDADDEVVTYVLESVKKNDAENGIFLNEHNLVQRTVLSDADKKLISF